MTCWPPHACRASLSLTALRLLPHTQLVKRLTKAARATAPEDAPPPDAHAAGAWVAAALDDDTLDVGSDGRLVLVVAEQGSTPHKRARVADGAGRPARAPPPPSTPDGRSRGIPPGASTTAAAAAANAAAAPSELPRWRASNARGDVKTGRFSEEERDALVAAVHAYATAKGLPPHDHGWLFETRTGPEKERRGGRGRRWRRPCRSAR